MDPALRATGSMHCNLNVRDAAAAARVYEALGLQVRMRSPAVGADSRPMGLDQDTDSEAWFLYDHRGGRRAPAVELVAWTDPPTVGEAYEHPGEVGMQALGFDVPAVETFVRAAVDAGASVREVGYDHVGATVVDLDGSAVELTAGAVPAATLRYARLVCADAAATADWYEMLGFEHVATTTRSWGDVRVVEHVCALAGPPGIELRLVQWPSIVGSGTAHHEPHHRGLFRMALSVPDVRAAVAAARAAGIEAGDPTLVPLPGTPLGGLWISFFRDPDGVMVEFVERQLS